MDYTIKAIPTTYKGIEFRSRLEAKWAAFFDLCGWRWEYEPCDFDGWIPDFQLLFGRQNPFIEVKPVSNPGEWPAIISAEVRSIPESGLIAVGIATLRAGECRDNHELSSLGPMFFRGGDISYTEIGECISCKRMTILCVPGGCYSEEAVNGFRPCFCCGKTAYHHGAYVWEANFPSVRYIWAKACNQTRWEPRR